MSDSAVTVPLADRDYRDPAALTQWLKGLLVLSLVMDLAGVGSGLMELAFLQDFAAGTIEGDFNAAADANDARQRTIGIAQFGLWVVTGVVFLTWIFRANRNARALGAKNMRFTPGWAVGWFFVPVMSLWKPFQAMREIWRASAAPGNWQAAGTSPLLGWWWALFLGAQTLAQVGFQLAKGIDSVESAMTASAFITASDLTSVGLDIAAILLVSAIAANQIWQAKTVEAF